MLASGAETLSSCSSCEIRVNFPTSKTAAIAVATMEVDDELQPDKITKQFRQEGTSLVVNFVSSDPKVLRVAISSFYDMLMVVARTFHEFQEEE